MSQMILDGTGKAYKAKVNKDNRLETFSINEERIADVSKSGYSFLLASDFVSLTTTGAFNGIIYIKNNSSTKDLFIKTIRVCSDGSGSVQCRIIRNPTTGTLISDANKAEQLSSNAGSNVTFDGLAYAASGDAKTVTDGSNWTQFINRSPGHSIQDYQGAILLPNGQSMALTAKPSVSTNLCIEVMAWFEDK